MGIMNRDGALFMATGVDNSGFRRDLNEAQNLIGGLESYAKKAGIGIGSFLGVQGLKAFGNEIINVRGEMQMLESSFEVLLGGKGVSGFMSEIKQFAVDSPLTLTGVSNAAQTLLGFNIEAEKVIPTIKQLGDISMGNEQRFNSLTLAFAQMSATGKLMGQDLNQMINAGFNPLQEMSARTGKSIAELKKEMEGGAISSEMVAAAFESATAQGGKFYGMTQKQAEGIKGLQAQLDGGLQDAFNDMGKSAEGAISIGYKGAITLVENYEKVGKVILELVGTYGTYKAAVVALSVVENLRYQSTLAQMAGMTRMQAIMDVLRAKTEALNVAMAKNPYVLVGIAVAALGYGLYKLYTYQTEAEKAQSRLNDSMKEGEKASLSETRELAKLKGELSATTKGTKEYNDIRDLIVSKFGQYYQNLKTEIDTVGLLDSTYQSLTKAIQASFSARQYTKFAQAESDNLDEILSDNLGKIQDRLLDDLGDELGTKYYTTIRNALLQGQELSKDVITTLNNVQDKGTLMADSRLDQYINNIREAQKIADDIDKKARIKFGGEDDTKEPDNITVETKKIKSIEEQTDEARKAVSKLKDDLINLRSGKIESNNYADDIEKKAKELKEAEDKLSYLLTGQSASSNLREGNQAERMAEKSLESQRKIDENDKQRQIEKLAFDIDMRQKLIDNMNEGYEKRIAILKLNSDKEEQAIKEFERKSALEQLEYAKNLFISSSGSEKGFESYYAKADLSKIMPEGLKPTNIASQVEELYAAARAANKKGLNDINKDIAITIKEERLQFAGELDQQISHTKAYFTERRQIVKAGSTEYFELLSLEAKAIESIKAQHNTKVLQMENEYKENAITLSTDLVFFQADKDAALLKQRIENNKNYIDSLKVELKALTGVDFDVLDETSLNKLSKDYPELVFAIRKAKQEQQAFNNQLGRTPAQKIMELSGLFNQISETLGDITGIDLSMLTDTINGIASFAGGDFIGAASSGLSIISTVVSGIINKKEQQAQIERELLKLQQEYNISLRQQNYDLISSIDYARAFRDNLEALHWLVEKGFISNVDYSVWEELESHAETASQNVISAQKAYDALFNKSQKGLEDMWGDRKGLSRVDQEAVNILSDWKDGIINIEEAYRRLGAKGYSGFTDMADQLARAKEETDKWTDSMVELSNQMDQFVTGTDFDGFLNNAMTAITNLKSGVSDLGDFTKQTLKDAILSSFKYKVLANALEPMYNQFADLFLADTMDVDAIKNWSVQLEEMIKTYADKLGVAYESLGLDFADSSSQSASKGGYETMSQDTGTAIEGRATAIQMSILLIEGYILTLLSISTDSNSILRSFSANFQELRNIGLDIMYSNRDIKKNTEELYEINSGIKDMSRKLDSL